MIPLCGWALAAYIAVSASITRSSTDWPGSATRTPMLVPQVIRRSPISRLSLSAFRILLATRRARTRLDLGSMTANSSPPSRATVSVTRTASWSRRAITRRTSSPALWPSVSLMPLKESRSRISRAGGISPRDVSASAWLSTEFNAVRLASWVSGSVRAIRSSSTWASRSMAVRLSTRSSSSW